MTCSCKVDLKGRARKTLSKLPRETRRRIEERLNELSRNPVCHKRLKPPLQGLCRDRVGDYRIIYKTEPCHITVIHIGHRENIYEKL